MSKTVLHLLKFYRSNAPLINNMIDADSDRFRSIACYLSGEPDGNNGMENVADKVIYCRLKKKDIYWTKISTLRRIANLIDEHNVDIVVCQFRRPMSIGAFAARLSRRKPKVIGIMHGVVGNRVSAARKLVNYFTYRIMARLVSVSEFGIADIIRLNIGLTREKVVAVQNGIDCNPYMTPSSKTRDEIFGKNFNNDFLFAMVGRLAPKKNHFRVIKAFANVVTLHPNARLLIFGNGPEDRRLTDLIESLNLGNNVFLMGYRSDISEILQHIDAFLLPSLYEGLPLALMEAMAAACPIITSNSGGMKEVAIGSDAGYMVDPDSLNQITNSMLTLLNMSSDELAAMGSRAKKHILDHFTAKKMAENYETLYLQILE